MGTVNSVLSAFDCNRLPYKGLKNFMRGLDKRFLDAMRFKLESGRRKGYVGWDQRWEQCSFPKAPCGPQGLMVDKLLQEVRELIVAIHEDDKAAIASESADVANLAMMICDIHDAMDFTQKGKNK